MFVADVAADSAAIVAQKGKPGQLYTVGATLPGNAELVEVHADHIVLRRAGTRETLTFPDTPTQFVVYDEVDDAGDWLENLGYDEGEALNGAFAPTDFSPADADDDPASARDLVTSYRELIDEDPQGALSELGIEPVSEGASAGYRLGDLADSPYLSQTGLQPGDVILSVNGRPVGDIRQDKMELDNVLAQGSARLEVQRGTRRFFVTASLQ